MTIRRTFSRLSVAIVIAGSTTSLGGQPPLVLVPVRMNQVMSAAQQRQTGVTRLTPEQRIALDGWLTRYSAELRQSHGAALARSTAAPQVRSGSHADDSMLDAPAFRDTSDVNDASTALAQRRRNDTRRVPLTAPLGADLISTPEEGTYVRLADGTLWEVYLPDRTATVTWRAGDYVAVSRAAAGVGQFDHVLVDVPARTRALAQFVGLVSPRRR